MFDYLDLGIMVNGYDNKINFPGFNFGVGIEIVRHHNTVKKLMPGPPKYKVL